MVICNGNDWVWTMEGSVLYEWRPIIIGCSEQLGDCEEGHDVNIIFFLLTEDEQELIVVTTERTRRHPSASTTTTTTPAITTTTTAPKQTTTTTTRLDRTNSGNQVLLKARKMSGNKKTYSANRLRAKVSMYIFKPGRLTPTCPFLKVFFLGSKKRSYFI